MMVSQFAERVRCEVAGIVSIKGGEREGIAQRMSAEVGAQDPRPKFITRPDCTLIWRSEKAVELLSSPMPIRIDSNRLWFDDHVRPERMQRFFEDVSAKSKCCLLRSKTRGHWALLKAWSLDAALPAIAVVCSLSIPCRTVTESGLAAEIKLTRSEAQVLDLFAKLHSPRQIAEKLEISIGTVLSHLKQIYSKAGVGSAVQMLQLTRAFCAN